MNIIIFGNVPLASWVIEKIQKSGKFNLVGVVCDEYDKNSFLHHGMNYPSVSHFCNQNNIRILDFNDVKEFTELNPAFGISVRYNKLFKSEFFQFFTHGIVNLHGGELPRFRGTNIANHAILEDVRKGAGTIHFIDEGVDTGDVCIRKYFDTSENETAYSFFVKTLSSLQESFLELLEILEEGKTIPRIKQSKLIENGEISKEYKHKDLVGKKCISISDIKNQDIDKIVRAFYFPKHNGAYIQENNNIFFLTKSDL